MKTQFSIYIIIKNIHTCDVDVNGSTLNNPLVGYKYDVKFWNAMFNALVSYILFSNCKLSDKSLYVSFNYLFVTFGWQYTIEPLFSHIGYFLLGSNKIGGLK